VSEVSIDPVALSADADQVAREFEVQNPAAPPPGEELAPVDPNQPTPEQIREGYRVLSLAVIDRGSSVLCPAWNITADEKGSLSSACAEALALWFPDQVIPPKYMALLVVAGVTLEIIDKRRDPKTGELMPRVHEPKKPNSAAVVEQRPAAPAVAA